MSAPRFTADSLDSTGLLREDLFIGGIWTAGTAGDRTSVSDPATGTELARTARATESDVIAAIEAATVAQVSWGRLPAPDRARVLRRWYELILEHEEGLAALLTAEQGKPLAEALGEIRYGASFVEWYAEESKRMYGDVIPTNNAGRRLITIRQPIGVVAAITPWNFPSAMILRKAGPALAAGCAMVLKPAGETPLSALALTVLAERAGLPPGVLNVVMGDAVMIGRVLTSHPAVRALSFTGSTTVGQQLMRQGADNVLKLALELGGNAPLIVFDDADLDEAVTGAIASKFRNAGQTCVCANRIYVQSGIHDEFVDAFTARVAELRVGNGFDEKSTQGPLISQAALDKVQEHISDAVAKGAQVVLGGQVAVEGGHFFQPTILVGATSDMKIASEETFGPVAPIFRFETEAEAIEMANDTPFGLASYFFTHDLGRVIRVAEALDFGVVGINTGMISYEGAPFGGMKHSGLGREGSRHGLDEFTEMKYLCLDGLGIQA